MLPFLLLISGTSLTITGQIVNNQASIDPRAQLLVLARYTFTFLLSAAQCAQCAKDSQPTKGKRSQAPWFPPLAKLPTQLLIMLVTVGIVDLGSYGMYNIGFAKCGSALATVTLAAGGQLSTALISVTVLQRRLNARHLLALAVSTLGLMVRALDDLPTAHGSKVADAAAGDNSTLVGVLCVMVSAVFYAILGCMYEYMMTDGKGMLTQFQISYAQSSIGLMVVLLHQMLYTLPNWQSLVAQPVAAAGQTGAALAGSHALYGLLTAAHQYVQVKLLATHGALALGLVNAVRASVVSFASSLLFCAAMPKLCITQWKAASAIIVSAGAAIWVTAGKPTTHKPASQPSGRDKAASSQQNQQLKAHKE